MIKRIVIGLLTVLMLAGCKQIKPALAEINLPEIIENLSLNQAIIFSLDENKVDYATSVTLVSLFNDKISIDLGYSPQVEALGLVSFKLYELKNIVKFPILDQIVIEPFIYAGSKRIENLKEFGEYSYGVGVKIVSLKW